MCKLNLMPSQSINNGFTKKGSSFLYLTLFSHNLVKNIGSWVNHFIYNFENVSDVTIYYLFYSSILSYRFTNKLMITTLK